ncbi:HupE/UreJ family protein [Mesorhizobium australafricanum]|uniref:HupE/UreJ family protein n=1 Tax=Mesorhizobium australafricanum TaxID=3072311 RepID=UPI003D314213
MRAAVWLLLAIGVSQAQAHDMRPAYLAITETGQDVYSILWKAPAMGEMRLAIYPRLPQDAVEIVAPEGVFLDDAYVERWTVRDAGGFAGQTIAIDGVPAARTDVLVRIERLSGETSTTRLTADSPSFEVPAATGLAQVAASYFGLGVEHILGGIDHLLFILALILLVRGWRRIALTVTAFTVAHSITLAAATLGFVHVPGAPVEAAIALSIALVAVEIVNSASGRQNLTVRLPWLVAFAFGLLHGLGFAGALSKVGLPSHAIPLALLFFNVGVELGQLLFIGTVLGLLAILSRLWMVFVIPKAPWSRAWPQLGAAYCIGGVASFWLIERVSAFWA